MYIYWYIDICMYVYRYIDMYMYIYIYNLFLPVEGSVSAGIGIITGRIIERHSPAVIILLTVD